MDKYTFADVRKDINELIASNPDMSPAEAQKFYLDTLGEILRDEMLFGGPVDPEAPQFYREGMMPQILKELGTKSEEDKE